MSSTALKLGAISVSGILCLSKLIVSVSGHRLPTLYQTPHYRNLLSKLVFMYSINNYHFIYNYNKYASNPIYFNDETECNGSK